MIVKVLLEKGETQEYAEEMLRKAILAKEEIFKVPHPDPVVNELSLKMSHAYNQNTAAMMKEIFDVIKEENHENK